MKLVVYRSGDAPIEIEADRLRVICGQDHFEMREQDGLLIRIEEHDGALAMHLALLPSASNGVRLKGGLR